jgi:UDP-N-acetylmuramoylalanine--D-glutamate ligase
VELSSFQLEKLSIKGYFDAAAILNITPNHLNRHASMQEYAEAKLRLGRCLKPDGKIFISKQVEKDFGIQNGIVFDCTLQEDGIDRVRKGLSESENEAAAKALVSFCGVSKLAAEEAMKTYRKPPHRIEWVAEIDGVAYYNDSKASNIEAVIHAVRLFSGPILLLIGGVDKGSSYTPWIECFQGKVKRIAAFGEAKEKMERELGPFFRVEKFFTMKEAFEFAKRHAGRGDTVLLSPGCSSYDQFANYEERGESFKKMVKNLLLGQVQGDGWIEKKP